MSVYMGIALGCAVMLVVGYSWGVTSRRSRRPDSNVAVCGFCHQPTGKYCAQCRETNRQCVS